MTDVLDSLKKARMYGFGDHAATSDCVCIRCAAIREIERLRDALSDLEGHYDDAMRADCGINDDAEHCTCVPLLKKEIDRLRAENERMAGLLTTVAESSDEWETSPNALRPVRAWHAERTEKKP